MNKCPVCGGGAPTMYLPDGTDVCNACFYADDTHRKEDSSSKQAITGGYVAIVLAVLGIGFCVLIGVKRLAVLPALLLAGGIAGIRHGREVQRRIALKNAPASPY